MARVDKGTVTSNFIWRLLERVGAQGVTFVVSIILARVLDPVVYGTVAIVTVFTTIMQVFVDSGLGNALIQKKDADEMDFSSVFYVNLLFCAVLYLLMFAAAPLIARFYENPELVPLIRVLSLTVVISGVKNVQQAYVARNLLFKRFFFATFGGTVGAALIGIWMAYNGYGVWALVVQNIFNQALDTVILWITVKWRPKLIFSFTRVKALFAYGWKLLVARLLDTIYTDLRQLIIGKVYTSEDLAFYNRAVQFPKTFVVNINAAVDSILFSVMAKEQNDRQRIRNIVRRSVQVNTYVLFPVMMGMGVCAEPFVRLLLTEKWLPCVPYLRIFCFTYAFVVFNTANQNSYQAVGRSDIYLRNEVLRKILGLVLTFATMWISVYAMALSGILATVVGSVINSWPNKKLINYGFWEQLKDMLPALTLTLIMGAAVYPISLLGMNDGLTLLIQVIVGVAIYVAGSAIAKLEPFYYLLGFIRQYLEKRKE